MEIRSLSTMPVVHLTNKQVASPTKEQGEIAKAVVNNKISAAYIGDKKDKKEIGEIKDKKLIKEMKAMRGMLFVMRCEYAYALLYEENENKANEIRKAFDMAAETYPYVSEVEGERYLMDKALSLMSK